MTTPRTPAGPTPEPAVEVRGAAGTWSESLASLDLLRRVEVLGLGPEPVSLVGVALDRPRPVGWGQHLVGTFTARCPLLDGAEVAVELSLVRGDLTVRLHEPGTTADVRVEMGWGTLLRWLPDPTVLLGDALLAGLRLDGNLAVLSALDGARVVSGVAVRPGAGEVTAAVSEHLCAQLAAERGADDPPRRAAPPR